MDSKIGERGMGEWEKLPRILREMHVRDKGGDL